MRMSGMLSSLLGPTYGVTDPTRYCLCCMLGVFRIQAKCHPPAQTGHARLCRTGQRYASAGSRALCAWQQAGKAVFSLLSSYIPPALGAALGRARVAQRVGSMRVREKEVSAKPTWMVLVTVWEAGSTQLSVELPSLMMREAWSVVTPQPSFRGPMTDCTLSRLLAGYSYSFPLFQISW